MPPDQRVEQPKHPAGIRRFALAFLFAVTLGSGTFIAYRFTRPEPPNPYAQAAELDAVIHQDPRFAEVHAECAYPSVVVFVTGQLSDEAHSDLEQLVRQHAPRPDTPIRNLLTEPELNHSTQTK